MRKILGATIGVCGVLAATLVLMLAMTAQAMDNDESNAQMTAEMTITSVGTMQATANPMKTDDGTDMALDQLQARQATMTANTAGTQASTEAANMAIFMGDNEVNDGFNGVALFMADESSGEVTEVDNPADGNMVGFIHAPAATNLAVIHNAAA